MIDCIRQAGVQSYVTRYNPDQWWSMPAMADYAWTNQGSASCVPVYNGSWAMHDPKRGVAAGASLKILRRAVPTAPYNYSVRIRHCTAAKSKLRTGICWREASSGKVVTFGFTSASLAIEQFTNETSYSSDYLAVSMDVGGYHWLRLRDTGSGLEFWMSPDGVNWQGVATMTYTAWFDVAPDQVGLHVDAENMGSPDLDAQMSVECIVVES